MHRTFSWTIAVGGNPERAHRASKIRHLLKWQSRAFRRLCRKYKRIIIAPTGSGKSLLVVALALDDLLRKRVQKVIVAVPQSIIAASFSGGLRIKLPTEGTVLWEPEHRLAGDETQTHDIVRRIREFLVTPLSMTRLNPERLLVCSHAALVAYHNKYHGVGAPTRDDWNDYRSVSFNIDEAHHSRYPEEGEEQSAKDAEDALRDEEVCNQLGGFVRDWLDHGLHGVLTLTTATWFRSDQIAIVPTTRCEEFTSYRLTAVDYLRTLKHLREIEIRFLSGPEEECVGQCYQERPTANTLVYIRPVTQGRDKLKDRDRILKRLGAPSHVDLVDPCDRARRKDAATKAIKSSAWGLDRAPWIIALMLGREGFDFPALQRSIVIGPRSSMVVMMQMLGRLLRDYPRKRRVQFNIVLPLLDNDAQKADLIRGYLKVVLAVFALGCLLSPPKLACSQDRTTFDKLMNDGPDRLADVLSVIAEAVGDDPTDVEALVDELVGAGRLPVPEGCEQDSFNRVVLSTLRAMKAAAEQAGLLAKLPDPKMAIDDAAGIRVFRLMPFGYSYLADLCRAIDKPIHFTPEAVHEAISSYGRRGASDAMSRSHRVGARRRFTEHGCGDAKGRTPPTT